MELKCFRWGKETVVEKLFDLAPRVMETVKEMVGEKTETKHNEEESS